MSYMAFFAFFLSILCLLHLHEATKANVAVTLHARDVSSIFSEEEIWGMQFQNQTENIVQLNVVIAASKLKLLQLQKEAILALDIIDGDVQPVLERERLRLNNRTKWTAAMRPEIFFLEYRDWIEYELFIDYILARFASIASRSYSGSTVQGRAIPVVTLSTGNAGGAAKNLYIQAAAHAREWLANAATMWILHALCEGYGENARITAVLDAIDIFIVPTVNIDGYIFSWVEDRMWRKNRRENGDGTFGVDLNRNYDGPANSWCTLGASSNPSSNSYCGTAAYSEPETQASRNFISNAVHNIGAAVDMHTSGPLILWPWGSPDPVEEPYYGQFVAVGDEIEAAIAAVHGVQYVSTQAVNLYPTSGTMRDFAFAQIAAYGFTWEGRGPGFDPPPGNIIPAGQEQLAGHLTLAEYIIHRR